MTNDIMTQAMLVGLSLSSCDFKKIDQRASKEAADTHGIDARKLRATKTLLPENAPEYVRLKKAVNAVRNEHYRQSLPWTDSGLRIISADQYFNYTNIMQQRINDVENALKDFMQVYSRLQQEAGLNDLYDPNDYPSVDELPTRFNCSINILPLPIGADFRCSMADPQATEAIRADIDRNTQDAVRTAMTEVLNTLRESVSKVVTKLSDSEATFRDSLITNLRELTDEWLPAFNLTKDPNLDAIGREIRSQLLADPDTLRSNPTYRQEIAAKAASIVRQMEGLY